MANRRSSPRLTARNLVITTPHLDNNSSFSMNLRPRTVPSPIKKQQTRKYQNNRKRRPIKRKACTQPTSTETHSIASNNNNNRPANNPIAPSSPTPSFTTPSFTTVFNYSTDEVLSDIAQTRHLKNQLKKATVKFDKACRQLIILDQHMNDLQNSYTNSLENDRKTFKIVYRMQLATLEGTHNAYIEYIERQVEKIKKLKQIASLPASLHFLSNDSY